MATMLTRRTPEELRTLRRLNHILDEAFGGWPFQTSEGNGSLTSTWIPACEVVEDSDSVKIVVEAPGVKPEDVQISVENNLLTMRGEKRQVAEESSDRVHRTERTYGVFERTFALPTTVEPDRIEASYDAGVLSVVIPKAERARPRQIEVKVNR